MKTNFHAIQFSSSKILPTKSKTWTEQRQFGFMEKIAKKYEIKNPNDWGKITWKTIVSNGGSSLVKMHGGLFKILKAIYPEIQWKEEWFNYHPRGYWRMKENRRRAMDQLAIKYNIQQPSDWEKVSCAREEIGRSVLANYYGNSLYRALKDLYPERDWKREWFSPGIWTKKANQRKYLDKIAIRLNVKSPKDWGSVPVRAVLNRGGNHLLKTYYGSSLFKTLQSVYPEIKWEREWFKNLPKYSHQHWDSQHNQKSFIEMISKEYCISTVNDWSRVTLAMIKTQGGGGLLKRYNNSIYELLASLYSDEVLKSKRYNPPVTRPQGGVLNKTRQIFLDKELDFPGLHQDVKHLLKD